jgi:hypothetical protein
MGVDAADVNAAKNILWPDERVEVTARQRRVGPGGSVTAPTSVIATDKRIIILNRANLGIRQDYEVIPYKQITSVRLEHGIISSSVFIRVQGYDVDKGLLKNGKQEGEIDGLNNKDAQALADFINKRLEDSESISASGEADSVVGGFSYCARCGNKNPAGASFCSKCGSSLKE